MTAPMVTMMTVASRRWTASFSSDRGEAPRLAASGEAGGARQAVAGGDCRLGHGSDLLRGRESGLGLAAALEAGGVLQVGADRGLGHVAKAGVGVAGLHEA